MGAGLRDIAPKEVYSAAIAASSGSGDVVVLDFSNLHPNDSSKKIVVINFLYTCNATETTTFWSGTSSGTQLTGDMLVFENGWVKGHYNPDGHFKTAAGADLVIARGGTMILGGWLNYYLE